MVDEKDVAVSIAQLSGTIPDYGATYSNAADHSYQI